MWSGSDDDFLRLYTTAARRIKEQFPNLKVGGPGFGATGSLKNDKLQPTEFLSRFLKHCRSERVPLDFLSWHCYTAQVDELVTRAKEIRKLLDAEGFSQTESHLNEWNYLPDNSWDAFGRTANAETRREFYARAQGPEGASFALGALIRLQDAKVDVANFFHGEIGGFGMFDEFGGETDTYRVFKAFNTVLARTPIRVEISAEKTNQIALIACKNPEGTRGSILLSNTGAQVQEVELSFQSWAIRTKSPPVLTLITGINRDQQSRLEGNQLSLRLERQTCVLIRFGPE